MDLVRLALIHPKGFTLVQGDASNNGEHWITLVLTIGKKEKLNHTFLSMNLITKEC